MAAGQEFSLFGMRSITDEWQQVGFYARKIKQRNAHGRRAIGRHGFAVLAAFQQEGQEVVFTSSTSI